MRRIASALALVATLALVAAGCGDSADNDRGGATGVNTGTQGSAAKGGKLTVLSSGDIDTLDPGAWYYQYTYMVLWQPTQRSLYGWKPDGRAPEPDLAQALPESSDGGKTLTIKLKPGIHYSAPLADRTVTSADVKYAIERAFLPQVANAYVNSYYADIVGVGEFVEGKADEIAGLEVPDDETLVIRLTKPVGVLASGQALAMPVTVPVPKDYAARYDKGERSTYGEHQVFTGPYMIANDGKGKLTGYEPGKRIELVRNPSWKADTDHRPAYLDTIVVESGNDPKLASEKILSGDGFVSGDLIVPPTVLKSALSNDEDKVDLAPSGVLRMITLNTTIEPLDNPDVRRAISAVTDRSALRLTRGGEVVGAIPTHYISPGIPGFEEAGGEAGPGEDFLANPEGDVALAMEYMKKAGYPSGKYDGPPLLMVGDNEAGAKAGQALQSQLAQIGIEVDYREVSFNAVQSKFCLVPAAEVAICPNLSWGRDFLDGQSVLDPIFHGDNITEAYNVNFSQVNDPELDRLIDDAEGVEEPGARAQAWAEIDERVTAEAYMVPWLWENLTNVRSGDVAVPRSTFSASWDLTYASLK